MATAIPRGLVGRKPLAKLRADGHDCMDAGGRATLDAKAEKHHIRLSLEARWPSTSKPRDLMGKVNDAVA